MQVVTLIAGVFCLMSNWEEVAAQVPLWWWCGEELPPYPCGGVDEGFSHVWGIQGYLADKKHPPQVVTLIAGVFCLTSNWEEVAAEAKKRSEVSTPCTLYSKPSTIHQTTPCTLHHTP